MGRPSRRDGSAGAVPYVYRKLLERSFFVLALLGMLVTLHMVLWYGSSVAGADDFVCGAGFDCQSVLANDPAPLGIPSVWWGVMYYALIGGLCIGIVTNFTSKNALFKGLRILVVGVGLLYSLFLTAYQFIILDDRCLLCLMSATVVVLMAGLLVIAWRKPAPPQTKRGLPVGELRFHGIAGAVMLVLLIADYTALPDSTVQDNSTVADTIVLDTSFDPSMCRYDSDKPRFENIDQLVRDYDPVIGPANAPVTVMEFLDPNCNHCRNVHPTMVALTQAFQDSVRFVYKPVTLVGGSAHSLNEVMALWIANEHGVFEEMLDLEFEHQSPQTGLSPEQLTDFAGDLGIDRNVFREALSSLEYEPRAREVLRFFSGMGLDGVPAVIIGGRLVHGTSRSLECMTHFINAELAAVRR